MIVVFAFQVHPKVGRSVEWSRPSKMFAVLCAAVGRSGGPDPQKFSPRCARRSVGRIALTLKIFAALRAAVGRSNQQPSTTGWCVAGRLIKFLLIDRVIMTSCARHLLRKFVLICLLVCAFPVQTCVRDLGSQWSFRLAWTGHSDVIPTNTWSRRDQK